MEIKKEAATERVVFLKGKKTVLCPPSKKVHLPLVLPLINDEETRQFIAVYLPSLEQSEEEWFDNLTKKSQTDIVLVVETMDGDFVGMMGIHNINWKDRVGTTGAVLVKRFRGKGYGTDAKMAILNYAFNTLGFHKLCSSVVAFNERSLNYSLKCGYRIEGKRRKQIFKNGRYYDEIILGVFRNEWLAARKKWLREGKRRKK